MLSSVFPANGGCRNGHDFVDGLTPALWIGTGTVLLAALAALVIPRRRSGRQTSHQTREHENKRAAVGV